VLRVFPRRRQRHSLAADLGLCTRREFHGRRKSVINIFTSVTSCIAHSLAYSATDPLVGLQATENAGLELSAPNCRGGKCGTKQLWKDKHLRDWKCSSYFLLVTAHATWSICPNLQCSVCFYISCMYGCYINRLRADTYKNPVKMACKNRPRNDL